MDTWEGREGIGAGSAGGALGGTGACRGGTVCEGTVAVNAAGCIRSPLGSGSPWSLPIVVLTMIHTTCSMRKVILAMARRDKWQSKNSPCSLTYWDFIRIFGPDPGNKIVVGVSADRSL